MADQTRNSTYGGRGRSVSNIIKESKVNTHDDKATVVVPPKVNDVVTPAPAAKSVVNNEIGLGGDPALLKSKDDEIRETRKEKVAVQAKEDDVDAGDDEFSLPGDEREQYFKSGTNRRGPRESRDSFVLERLAQTNKFWLNCDNWWVSFGAGKIIASFNVLCVPEGKEEDLIERFVHQGDIVVHVKGSQLQRTREDGKTVYAPLCVASNAGMVFMDEVFFRVTKPVEQAKVEFVTLPLKFTRGDGELVELRPMRPMDNSYGDKNDNSKVRDNRNGSDANRYREPNAVSGDRGGSSVRTTNQPRRSDQPRQSGGFSASGRGGRSYRN